MKEKFTSLLLLFVLISILAAVVYCFTFSKNENTQIDFSNIVILIGVAIGLLLYYLYPTSGYDSIAFSIGFTLFITILFFMLVQIQLDVTKEMATMTVFKELAYTDTMTTMKNRAAFEKDYGNLGKGINTSSEEGYLLIFDVNNLKGVNDTFGHSAGDELIKGAASCIIETFSSAGNSYRLGGDEFGVIILNDVNIEKLIESFDELINEYNLSATHKVSIAKGCSYFKISELDEDKKRELFQETDDKMYQNKMEMKSEFATVKSKRGFYNGTRF